MSRNGSYSLQITPFFQPYRPVSRIARKGEHNGWLENMLSQTIPSAAIRSRLGVRTTALPLAPTAL